MDILTTDNLRALYTVDTDLFISDATAAEYNDSINVSGKLFCKTTGKNIGYFSRRFIHMRDSWHADHKNFYITAQEFKGRGIGRVMYGRALGFYARNGVSKISLEAVRDGRYVWLKYGFKPERTVQSVIHTEIRRAYKRETGKDLPVEVRLPRHGPKILRFKYGGVAAGKLAVDRTSSFVLTMDLTNINVRFGLISRGWLMPWHLYY